MQRVLEVYDNYIWKELDKTDATVAEVRDFMNIVSTNDFHFLPFLMNSYLIWT